MKQEQKSHLFGQFKSQVRSHIDDNFSKYNQEVQRKNQDHSGATYHKNDMAGKIYSSLQEVARELTLVQKQLKDSDKLRRERRELYQRKTAKYLNVLNLLTQDKHLQVKITPHFERLVSSSRENVTDLLVVLRKYRTESLALCGKGYDYKPLVEQAFLELAEFGFLWENVAQFESVTDESVKEIFLPIAYKQSDVQSLEGELGRIWNDILKNLEQYEYPLKAEPPAVETKIIQNDLQKAHEYLFGFTRPQEIHKAIEIYQKEAAKAHPDPSVFNALGSMHEQGRGFPKDQSKAFKYFMRAAEKGEAEGLYRVGLYLEKGMLNFKQHFEGLYANRDAQVRGGIEYYEKAAAKGHLDALTDLGFIYEKGVVHDSGLEYFIEPHPDHAKRYYEKAKESHFPRAYNNLGNLLICENTVCSDLEQNANLQKGIKYLNKAKDLGCARASLNLGKCYQSGTGVAINKEKARALFKDAAELGYVQGRLEYLRSYIGSNLEEEDTMTELVDTVREVLADNRKNPEALYMMGLLQERGVGVAANKEASFHYIVSSARLDYPPALTRLGDYYYSGYHVDKNYDHARVIYEKAAEKQESQAFLNLALMQEKGLIPMASSIGSADELYDRAEELGNTNSLLIRGMRNQANLAGNAKLLRAAEQGNYKALKLLSLNETLKGNQLSKGGWLGRGSPELKKLSTFYVKETLEEKNQFHWHL